MPNQQIARRHRLMRRKDLWSPCETVAPMQLQHHKTRSCIPLWTMKWVSRCRDSRIPPAAGWKENKDSHILGTFERHLASMEHTDSQYTSDCTKAAAHCLLTSYTWKDTVETTTTKQTPQSDVHSSLTFFLPFSIFFPWCQGKRNSQSSSEIAILSADFQCWMHTAKTEVTMTEVGETANHCLLLLLTSSQIHHPVLSAKLNTHKNRISNWSHIQEAGWKKPRSLHLKK